MRPRTQTGYFSTSKKFKKVAFREIKSQAKEYKKSDENFIRSLFGWDHWEGYIPTK